jgi:hypothetical protein
VQKRGEIYQGPGIWGQGGRIVKSKIKNQNAKIQMKYKKGNCKGLKIFLEG